MRRRAAACLTVLVAATLSGCGTSSYCTAVEKHRAAIDDATLTTASFTALGEALRAIETDAPSDVRDDYTAVAEAVEALLAAEAVAEVPIEELTHGDVVDLSEDDTAALRTAAVAAARICASSCALGSPPLCWRKCASICCSCSSSLC